MAQVKNVLGRDAIILHTRTFRKGGVLGFFAKERVEVMAGIDTPVAPIIERKNEPPVEVMPKVTVPVVASVEKKEESAVGENKKFAEVQLELANMSKILQQILSNDATKSTIEMTSPILSLLHNNDIDVHVAEKIIRKLPDEHKNDKKISPELKELIIIRLKNSYNMLKV